MRNIRRFLRETAENLLLDQGFVNANPTLVPIRTISREEWNRRLAENTRRLKDELGPS